MKRTALILMTAILGLSVTAMADVKVKIKQTMSGQVSENTSYIKGKRQRTEMMNGAFVSITQCDLGRDLQLNPQTRTYMVNLYDDGTPIEPGTVKAGASAPATKGGTMFVTTTIKDTGERKKMFGYTARHIIQTIETETSPDSCQPTKSRMEMDMWVIDAEFGLACALTRTYRPTDGGRSGGCRDRIQQKTIGTARSGYPVYQKMTGFDANGKESYSMVQEVVELSKATLEASIFDAPADYREVKNASEMYASAASANESNKAENANSNPSLPSSGGLGSGVSKAAQAKANDGNSTLGPKKPGTIRIGLASVKTGAVGEGISASDLAAAVRNTLGDFLKGTKLEVVTLEARLASAQADEGKQKECDFVVYSNVSHKKGGGGGFGLGKMLAQTVAQTGVLGHTGSVAGNVAGHVASQAIITAASLSGSVKKKDEITFDVKLQAPDNSASPLTKQFKAKAQSDGDDIISSIVEQAAQAIVSALGL